MSASQTNRRLVAVLAADVVGYSRMMSANCPSSEFLGQMAV
jgi:class 3 adenylate cyclase